jgi:uncharacterized membrane protein (UPF0127 family)
VIVESVTPLQQTGDYERVAVVFADGDHRVTKRMSLRPHHPEAARETFKRYALEAWRDLQFEQGPFY